jgi:hypothetical protein
VGTLIYGGSFTVELDDRLLAHLQLVIAQKLRRHESFFLTWVTASGQRTTVWLSPAIPLLFQLTSAQMPPINRAWLETLIQSSNTPGGLTTVPEPLEQKPAEAKLAETRPAETRPAETRAAED